MTANLSRVLIAATHSGAGKTTFTCALLQALTQKNLRCAAFKCGPDYIDPLFHSEVIGATQGNLDLFFTDENTLCAHMADVAADCDISVIEGVMGYYDGLGVSSDEASAYHVATATQSPVLLVVDVGGACLSVCALIRGFVQFRSRSRIAGVILNRCSPGLFQMLAPAIERECGIKALGYLPKSEDFALESRHLGLVTAAEVVDLRKKLDLMAEALAHTVDLQAILDLAWSAPALEFVPPVVKPETDKSPVIAVARDKAFCFYYRENLALLQRLGAKLVFFSPLEDQALPEGASALYLGGGYPELYGQALSVNLPMREAIAKAVENKMPVFAECGGFMYLHRTLTDQSGQTWPLCGVIDADCHFTGRLVRFGYVTLKAQCTNLLSPAGREIRGHEFHYFDSEENGGDFTAAKPGNGRSWPCIHATESFFAGFPHLYFPSAPDFARSFVRASGAYANHNSKEAAQ